MPDDKGTTTSESKGESEVTKDPMERIALLVGAMVKRRGKLVKVKALNSQGNKRSAWVREAVSKRLEAAGDEAAYETGDQQKGGPEGINVPDVVRMVGRRPQVFGLPKGLDVTVKEGRHTVEVFLAECMAKRKIEGKLYTPTDGTPDRASGAIFPVGKGPQTVARKQEKADKDVFKDLGF